MKKTLSVCAAAIMAGTLMTGCSLFQKANGIILYGDEVKVAEALEQEKEEFIGESQYPIKIVAEAGEWMMVLSEETAQAIADKELLREVTSGDKTKAISSVAKLSEGEAVVYAKNEQEQLNLDGQNLKASYGGNSIIGDGRAYVEKFLIVDDADWPKIEGEEKFMAIMEYKKDPSIKLMDFDVDDTQLVRVVE